MQADIIEVVKKAHLGFDVNFLTANSLRGRHKFDMPVSHESILDLGDVWRPTDL